MNGMQAASTIQWLPPVPPVTVGLIALAILAAFGLMRWIAGAPRPKRHRGAILAIRACVVLTITMILINPVRVEQTPGRIEHPEVVYLLDASQSMGLGDEPTRFDQALEVMRHASTLLPADSEPQIHLFRFGAKLQSVEPQWMLAQPSSKESGATSGTEKPRADLAPTDPDTRLGVALRQLPTHFRHRNPQMVVVFSDGRVRDPAEVMEMASRYVQMSVPIHVVPCGREHDSGDVAVACLAVPHKIRKHARVPIQVYIRSYGFEDVRAELLVNAVDRENKVRRQLSRMPLTLRDGVQSIDLTFQAGLESMRIQASIAPLPNEISTGNNALTTHISVDRTKIRVLQIDGAVANSASSQTASTPSQATSAIRRALKQDPDMECVVAGPRLKPAGRNNFNTPFHLFSFDVVVIGNVPSQFFPKPFYDWLTELVGRRGGGLCVIGGPRSFASGRWRGSPLESLLPVTLRPGNRDWLPEPTTIQPVLDTGGHPIWAFAAEEEKNRLLLASLPHPDGFNRFESVKSAATVLATAQSGTDQRADPLIVAQAYGRGRSMAIAPDVSESWAKKSATTSTWDDMDWYGKFWRNMVYWLAENSQLGRRRLVFSADKQLYRPGETIHLRLEATRENSVPTTDYRVAVIVEPLETSLDMSQLNSPVRRANESVNPPDDEPRFVQWGEESSMLVREDGTGYELTLPLASAQELAATHTARVESLHLEAAAYEQGVLVDSTGLQIQILNDPEELQTPLPNHASLQRLASAAGGDVLTSPKNLAARMRRLPIHEAPPTVTRTPLWNTAWLLTLLIALLTTEWLWRRRIGLA